MHVKIQKGGRMLYRAVEVNILFLGQNQKEVEINGNCWHPLREHSLSAEQCWLLRSCGGKRAGHGWGGSWDRRQYVRAPDKLLVSKPSSESVVLPEGMPVTHSTISCNNIYGICCMCLVGCSGDQVVVVVVSLEAIWMPAPQCTDILISYQHLKMGLLGCVLQTSRLCDFDLIS